MKGVITGRPTTYTPEIANLICDRLSTSSRGLEVICEDEDMPGASTVWRWLSKHTDFREMYVRAREFQTELMYDEMEKLIDAPLPETEVYDLLGNCLGKKVDAGAAMAEMQRRKLAIDVMKFKLVKLQPKRFGDNKSMDLNVKMTHQVTADQYQKLLATAAAAPQIVQPFYEEAEVVQDYDSSSVADDFLALEEEDDDLG